jgi:hypothetical protein
MANFKPDERQQQLIETALASHHEAQVSGQYAPDRLVEKWSSEVGIDAPERPATQPRRHALLEISVMHAIEHFGHALKRFTGH